MEGFYSGVVRLLLQSGNMSDKGGMFAVAAACPL